MLPQSNSKDTKKVAYVKSTDILCMLRTDVLSLQSKINWATHFALLSLRHTLIKNFFFSICAIAPQWGQGLLIHEVLSIQSKINWATHFALLSLRHILIKNNFFFYLRNSPPPPVGPGPPHSRGF